MELNILKYLEINDCSWHTVLIDFIYSRIYVYVDAIGLDPDRDLGEDWETCHGGNFEDSCSNDLYNYCEMLGSEILDLKDDFYIL